MASIHVIYDPRSKIQIPQEGLKQVGASYIVMQVDNENFGNLDLHQLVQVLAERLLTQVRING